MSKGWKTYFLAIFLGLFVFTVPSFAQVTPPDLGRSVDEVLREDLAEYALALKFQNCYQILAAKLATCYATNGEALTFYYDDIIETFLKAGFINETTPFRESADSLYEDKAWVLSYGYDSPLAGDFWLIVEGHCEHIGCAHTVNFYFQ